MPSPARPTVEEALEFGYPVSQDYPRLWKLTEEGNRVVCFVDYRGNRSVRDVATTRFQSGIAEIGARGICYVWCDSESDFVVNCIRYGVAFVDPHLAREGAARKGTFTLENRARSIEAGFADLYSAVNELTGLLRADQATRTPTDSAPTDTREEP